MSCRRLKARQAGETMDHGCIVPCLQMGAENLQCPPKTKRGTLLRISLKLTNLAYHITCPIDLRSRKFSDLSVGAKAVFPWLSAAMLLTNDLLDLLGLPFLFCLY